MIEIIHIKSDRAGKYATGKHKSLNPLGSRRVTSEKDRKVITFVTFFKGV